MYSLGPDSRVEDSVFFTEFPAVDDIPEDGKFDATWSRLLEIRSEITRVLETARREKVIGLSLDAEVLVQASGETAAFLEDKWEQLQELCIVSSLKHVGDIDVADGTRVTEAEGIAGMKIGVRQAPGVKCERCWTISTTVGQDSEHPAACQRCARVVRSLGL